MKPDTLKKKANAFHEKFDFELKNEYVRLSEFKGSHEMLTALHIPCGEIRTATARDFFRKGCPICARMQARHSRVQVSADEYIRKIETMYDVTAISKYNGMRKPMQWKCNRCGYIIDKTVENILWRKGDYGGGLTCDCKIIETGYGASSGEIRVMRYLREHGITYQREVRFNSCKRERPLPFDFIAYDAQGNPTHAVEFNGEQHYDSIEWFGGECYFEKLKESEKIKQDWCKEHGIPLLIIKYDSDVETELTRFFLLDYLSLYQRAARQETETSRPATENRIKQDDL